jgi:hypothetical protein
VHASGFDALARKLSIVGARREFLRVLAGIPLVGPLAIWHEEEAEAGRHSRRPHNRSHRVNDKGHKSANRQEKRTGKGKGKNKKGKKDKPQCADVGQTSKKDKRCCQGLVKDDTGRCVFPPSGSTSPGCAATCAGCCAGETCITATTDAACGIGGAPCAQCAPSQTCGKNAPGVCGCTPMTTCPAPLNCNSIDNGCGTDMIDCGNCTFPETCGGGTPPKLNVCGCTPPECPDNLCGDFDRPCGGMISCNPCQNPKLICTIDGGCLPCGNSNLCRPNHLCVGGECFACNVCDDPDGCNGSVQTAVDGADPNSIIYICPGIYKGTIRIDKNLTLIGAGSEGEGNTVLHGGDNRPVITIHLDDSADQGITVVFQSVTITGGLVPDTVPTGDGGGIFIHSHQALATLAMMDCVVFGNKADLGGGVFNSDGAVSLKDCKVLENEATSNGGGIYTALGSVALNDSHVTDNTANQGGGIYSDFGTVTLDGESSVTGNTAAVGPNNCAGNSVTGCTG